MDAILNSKNMISDILNGISVVVEDDSITPEDPDNDQKCTLWVKEGDIYTPAIYILRTASCPEAIIWEIRGSPLRTLMMFMQASQPGLLKNRRVYGALIPCKVRIFPRRSANLKSAA